MKNKHLEKFCELIDKDNKEEVASLLKISSKEFNKNLTENISNLVEYAARYNKIECLTFLMYYGNQNIKEFKSIIKNKEFKGFTILQNACFKNRYDVAKIFLKFGISFEVQEIISALNSALEGNSVECVNLILNYYETGQDKEEVLNHLMKYIDKKIDNLKDLKFDMDCSTTRYILTKLFKEYIKDKSFDKINKIIESLPPDVNLHVTP